MLSQKEPFYLMILDDLVLHTLGADIWHRASAVTRSFTLNSRVSTVFDVTSSRASHIPKVCLWIFVDMVRTSMNLFLSGWFLSKMHSVPQ